MFEPWKDISNFTVREIKDELRRHILFTDVKGFEVEVQEVARDVYREGAGIIFDPAVRYIDRHSGRKDRAVLRHDCCYCKKLTYSVEEFINNPEFRGMALLVAAYSGLDSIVTFLLSNGADINFQTGLGHRQTPLILATREGHVGMVDLLIRAGADLDLVDSQCNTALIYAAKDMSTVLVEKLLHAGADPNVFGDHGTALVTAIRCNDNNFHFHGFGKPTAPEVVRMLISGHTDVNRRDRNGYTPLMYACKLPVVCDIADILIQQGGARVHIRDGADMSALHHATQNIKCRAMRILVELASECDINAQDVEGRTPLMYASARGNMHALEVLLAGKGSAEKRVELDIQDGCGNTALMLAAMYGRADTLMALLQAGASVAICNIGRESVAEYVLGGVFDAPDSYGDNERDAMHFLHYLCLLKYHVFPHAGSLYAAVLHYERESVDSKAWKAGKPDSSTCCRYIVVRNAVFYNADLCRCIFSYLCGDGDVKYLSNRKAAFKHRAVVLDK